MEGYQWGRGEENGWKGTENRKDNRQVQNRQGEVKKVQEMEKPKNLYVQSMDMNWRWGNGGGWGDTGRRGCKGIKNGTPVIA